MKNMTNLQHLMNSLKRAQNEHMMIVKNGAISNEGFVVIHEDKAYNVGVEDNKVVSCTCPHASGRNVICKHMIRVSLHENLDITGLTTNVVSLPIAVNS